MHLIITQRQSATLKGVKQMNIAASSKSKNIVPIAQPLANSPEHHISSTLAKFNYSIDDLVPQATQFLIYKLFVMCESDDAMTSLKGIELMGKTAYCGLFKDKVEVSYSHKSSEELQQELHLLAVKLGLANAL
jgi:hypothetical protein